jgi:NTE family protein
MGDNLKIGLALGGGGARGLAHIGVLEAFKKNNIEIDLISGTSMGAIIGAAYCLEKDIDWVRERTLRLVKRKQILNLEKLSAPTANEEKRILIEGLVTFVKELYLWNMRAIKKWLVDISHIESVINELVQEKGFEELILPFFAVACDLNTGREIILSEGKLKHALLASSAIPGVFSPIPKGEYLLVDGGIVSLVPINACRAKGADFVIAVDVAEEITPRQFTNGMEIIFQSDLITQGELNRVKLKEADFIIKPDVKKISWAQFSASQNCVKKGEEAAQIAIPKIKSLIEEKQKHKEIKKSFIKRLFLGWRR